MKKKMKNKAFSVLISVLILISIFSFQGFAVQLGDIDADGKVTAGDARTALRYSVGLESLSPDGAFRADVDRDGAVFAADARTILRISVGLSESRYISNQYDMIRCGVFDYFGERLDTETGKYEYFELSRTTDTVHLLTEFEGVKIAVLIKGDIIYMVSHEKKIYLVTPDEVFSSADIDKGQLLDAADMGADYPSLDDAYSIKDATVEGYPCKVYLMKKGDGVIEAAMCGNRLVRIREFDSSGKLTAATIFYSVSMSVPSHKKEIPSDYKKYEGKLQAITFVGELIK